MISKIKNNLKYLPYLLRSFYFNWQYFPFSVAIRLPILISPNVRLLKTKGVLEIQKDKIKFGLVRIGFGYVGIFDCKNSKAIWEVSGKVIFRGQANIGHGSKISVGPKGTLNIGDNFCITAESSIVCFNHITIGDDCLLAWDVLIMDTDFHKVLKENVRINEDKSIGIGKNNWIGCRTTILKGTKTGTGCIIGAQSLLNKDYEKKQVLIAGNPAKIIQENVEWTY
jgi:serine acetyltransferase